MSLTKKNIRSVRFSDEMMELIEQQVGSNFTQKFERLVYNAYMLADRKKIECDRLDTIIEAKRHAIEEYQKELRELELLAGNVRRYLEITNRYLEDYMNGDL